MSGREPSLSLVATDMSHSGSLGAFRRFRGRAARPAGVNGDAPSMRAASASPEGAEMRKAELT